ncbi:type 2 isopentenyl-diphosphate Delta-isomerase [Borrelia sp. BU AG58]|uniref:type 2 isopentenyl-diphosphate Delta-isomerase n=1 Tax=Borrelia sp. BU AG58 TaxID=2887345 RepID=UPI001E457E59|nr:type 2 isopentenyl-diphosphate Delta-isomerase [Borrelia sp. BU AG58]UER67832.1 type 2 isopentenyl-diphosphate Delta-isomerase [Borrelia sp. BU AG58]
MGIEPNILKNKRRHIGICLNKLDVSKSDSLLGLVNLKHDALSELDFDEIDTSESIFGYKIAMPVFVSSMTGGVREGNILNRSLVKISNDLKIPMSLGSFKLLFKYPEYIKDFTLRKYADDIPLFSNIGATQVREFGTLKITEMNKRLEVDAVVVHLNTGQELMNSMGERSFKGIKDAIARLCSSSNLPVIVKETGFGMLPESVVSLLNLGVSYVDLAGSGGTNWVLVEGIKEENLGVSSCFSNWGIASVLTLMSINDSHKDKVFASGGYESGIDIAKGIALGAKLVGVASAILRAFCAGGEDGLYKLLRDYEYVLKMAMLLSNSKNTTELRANKYYLSYPLSLNLKQFKDFI